MNAQDEKRMRALAEAIRDLTAMPVMPVDGLRYQEPMPEMPSIWFVWSRDKDPWSACVLRLEGFGATPLAAMEKLAALVSDDFARRIGEVGSKLETVRASLEKATGALDALRRDHG